MIELAMHMVRPLVRYPDQVAIQAVETEEVTILEAILHPEDRARLEAEDGRTLRAIRTLLSAAAGRRKATIELVEAFGAAEE